MTVGTKTAGNLWCWYTVPAQTSAVRFAHYSNGTEYGSTGNLELWTMDNKGRCNQFTSSSSSSSFSGNWGHYTDLINNISYDTNGGIGSISGHTVKLNNATLSDGTNFTRDGYDLDHWDLNAEGTIRSISLGADVSWTNFISYEKDANVTLYAQWRAKKTYYFTNTSDWVTPYAYAWSGSAGSETKYLGNWPGTACTLLDSETKLWKITVNSYAEKIIFSNNGANQSADLTLSSNENKVFNYSGNSWAYGTFTTQTELVNAHGCYLPGDGTFNNPYYFNPQVELVDGYTVSKDVTVTVYGSYDGESWIEIVAGHTINCGQNNPTYPTIWNGSDGFTMKGTYYTKVKIKVEGTITANKYTISLLNNGATSSGTTAVYELYKTGVFLDQECTSYQMGGSANPITLPQKTGYTFGGYYKNADFSGNVYINSSGYATGDLVYGGDRFIADTDLYAKWTANSYTVTFDKQSGSGGSDSVSATFGSAMPAISLPNRDGYNFAGYFSEINGGGTKYYNADGSSATSWDIAEDTTLYAHWTGATYNVTFDKQSGSGGSDSTTATYGSSMPDITLPTRSGYNFAGYFDATGGSGTQYYNADGTSAHVWDKTSTSTLYAHWTAATYNVTFDKQSGSGGSDSVSATYNSTLPNISVPNRVGYDFAGYFDQINGQGTQYYNADGTSAHIWDKASASTLYAFWTAKTYNITKEVINASGIYTVGNVGTFDTIKLFNPIVQEETGYEISKTVTISIWGSNDGETYSKIVDDYSVQCLTEGGSSGSWVGSSSYTMTGTYYPYIKIKCVGTNTLNEYSINYELNGGTNNPNNPSSYNITTDTITLGDPTKNGYTFLGWTFDGQASPVKNPTIVKGSTGNKTYTANWEANTFTIHFDGSGATSGSMEDITGTYDQPLTLPSNGFSKTGNTFLRWAVPGVATYVDKQSLLAAHVNDLYNRGVSEGSVTLYAQWSVESYTLTVTSEDVNKGTVIGGGLIAYNSSATVTASANAGYTFEGWYNGETRVSSDATYMFTMPPNDLSLVAKFTAKEYVNTFWPYNGETEFNKTVTFGTIHESVPIPTKTGYTFNGYYSLIGDYRLFDENGDIISNVSGYTDASGNWIYDGALNFRAKYDNNVYTITLEGYSGVVTTVTTIYEKYDVGMFLDSNCTLQMTGIANPINPLPTLAGKVYAGYYYNHPTRGFVGVIDQNGYVNGYSAYGNIAASDATFVVRFVDKIGAVIFTSGNNVANSFVSTESSSTSGYPSGTQFINGTTLYYYITIKSNTSNLTYSSTGTKIGETNVYLLGTFVMGDNDVDLGVLNCLCTVDISDSSTLTLADRVYIFDNQVHNNSISTLVLHDSSGDITLDLSLFEYTVTRTKNDISVTDPTDGGLYSYIVTGSNINDSYNVLSGTVSSTYCIDDTLEGFVTNYMHPEVPTSESGTGKCISEEWYNDAKTALTNITSTYGASGATTLELQNAFKTSETYRDYYMRYQNWARANGDSSNILINGNNNSLNTLLDKEGSIILIVVVAAISLPSLFCVYSLSNKRKKK